VRSKTRDKLIITSDGSVSERRGLRSGSIPDRPQGTIRHGGGIHFSSSSKGKDWCILAQWLQGQGHTSGEGKAQRLHVSRGRNEANKETARATRGKRSATKGRDRNISSQTGLTKIQMALRRTIF